MTPQASVIMCVRNEERHIEDSISSILNQTFTEFELIIIDDASTDNTVNLILAFTDSRIRLIRNNQHLGIAQSRNIGTTVAKSPIIVVADADDLSLPHRLQAQIQYLNKHPEVGVVGAYAHAMDVEGQELGIIKSPADDLTIKNEMKTRLSILHCALAVRKDALANSGGYRAKFIAGSDYDLLARLSEQTVMAAIPTALCCYRLTPNSISIRCREIQRFCIDLVQRFAKERSISGRDSYDEFQIDELKHRVEHHGQRVAYARYHIYVGKLAGAAGKMQLARSHYLRSLLRYPAQLEAYALLAAALAGTKIYQAIQQRFGTTSIEPE